MTNMKDKGRIEVEREEGEGNTKESRRIKD